MVCFYMMHAHPTYYVAFQCGLFLYAACTPYILCRFPMWSVSISSMHTLHTISLSKVVCFYMHAACTPYILFRFPVLACSISSTHTLHTMSLSSVACFYKQRAHPTYYFAFQCWPVSISSTHTPHIKSTCDNHWPCFEAPGQMILSSVTQCDTLFAIMTTLKGEVTGTQVPVTLLTTDSAYHAAYHQRRAPFQGR